MTTEAKIQLTSTELGALWRAYITISGDNLILDFLKDKTIDIEAKNILTDSITEYQNIKSRIVNLYNDQKTVIPIGFNERDVIMEAPPLFDDLFNIMYLRQIMKLALGNCAIFFSMSYMEEVQNIVKLISDGANKYYAITTKYLLNKGVLAKPPYVTMPKTVEFIEDKNYMSGHNLFSEKRSLNTIEVGLLNEAIEDNIFGMQLMTGFAQVAKEKEVKKYFIEGKELSKKIISKLSDVLLQSDIQPPSTWAGRATDSTIAPFSDKLMMYMTSLIANTSISFTSLGTSFSMRSDLHAKLALITKDSFDYSKKGGKIMIEYKWMEAPPQMEDRNQLTKIKE